MKKQITITIVAPGIITDPPQPESMDLKIEGLNNVEVLHYLVSTVAQMAARELPVVIQAIKAAQAKNPIAQPPGQA